MGRRLIGATVLLLFLSGCLHKERSRLLLHDAYVWQRRWNAATLSALTESASSIRAWRVLAAEADTETHVTEIAVNRQTLKQIGKPVIAVIRIDGRSRTTPLGEQLIAQSVALAADWKKDGVPVLGIEIDYDCATDRLRRYRDFLHLLRRRVGREVALSITALPSWMGSRDLPSLLAEVDETVLQVHSVMNPQKGLFDRSAAYQWAQAWSTLSPVPFRIALPTYWSRVTWNDEGRVVSIESEAARYGREPIGRELIVEPGEVSSLVAALQQAPPRHLAGVAWFRLPTAEDQRAWTPRTWHAVMKGQVLRATPPVVRFQADGTGVRNVYLRNESDVDAKLPAQVLISADGCEFADALPPYDWERKTNGVQFRLKSNNLLRAGQERLVGWVRCSGGKWEGHASF